MAAASLSETARVSTAPGLSAAPLAGHMNTPNQEIVELNMNRIEELLQRAEAALTEEDYETVKEVFKSYLYLTDLVEDKATPIERL